MTACATKNSVINEVKTISKGPVNFPTKNITNFSDGLRCMDKMIYEYGRGNISILIEDLEDKTKKIPAGTKDILINSLSSMSKQNRAIKLISFGNDSGNLVSFLAQAGSRNHYKYIPQFGIRGSISQLDKGIVRKQNDGGIANKIWGLGGSKSNDASILGLDLSVISSSDMSVIPGVTSSNSVIIFKSGHSVDTDAVIKKVGVNFSFNFVKEEGKIQALRNLVELASIELIGKLLKLPYWECLSIPAESPQIQQEVEDWYHAMKNHNELLHYIKQHLWRQGFYFPEEDNTKKAMSDYLDSIDAINIEEINLNFFNLLLNKQSLIDHPKYRKLYKDNIHIHIKKDTPIEENYDFLLSANQPSYVYCFHISKTHGPQKILPSDLYRNNFLEKNNKLLFSYYKNSNQKKIVKGDRIICFASHKSLFFKLPPILRSNQIEISNLDKQKLIDIFKNLKNEIISYQTFTF